MTFSWSIEKLSSLDVRNSIYTLDSSFTQHLQESVNLSDYSEKLSKCASFLIVKCKLEFIGVIAFYTNTEKSELYIPFLCVKAMYRRMGIGDLLMTNMCDYANKHRQTISLEVRNDNIGAIKLYQKYGFRIIKSGNIKSYMTRKF